MEITVSKDALDAECSTDGEWSRIYDREPPKRNGYRRGTCKYEAIRDTACIK